MNAEHRLYKHSYIPVLFLQHDTVNSVHKLNLTSLSLWNSSLSTQSFCCWVLPSCSVLHVIFFLRPLVQFLFLSSNVICSPIKLVGCQFSVNVVSVPWSGSLINTIRPAPVLVILGTAFYIYILHILTDSSDFWMFRGGFVVVLFWVILLCLFFLFSWYASPLVSFGSNVFSLYT